MRFKIELDSGNDNLQTPNDLIEVLEYQVSRLRKAAMFGHLDTDNGAKILDINGNTIGSWEFEK